MENIKVFKALYIDNGVIKAGEFPVEPEKLHDNDDYDAFLERQEEIEIYRVAVNYAKANAVECEDQEKALGLAIITCPSDAILLRGEMVVGVQDGIYRFPYGWDYRVEIAPCERCSRDCYNFQMRDCKDRKVAKLFRVDEQKDEDDGLSKFCKVCNQLSGPNHHSGCDSKEDGCVWAEQEESQEALWGEAEDIIAEAMGTYKTSLTVALASYARKELEKRFAITRRK